MQICNLEHFQCITHIRTMHMLKWIFTLRGITYYCFDIVIILRCTTILVVPPSTPEWFLSIWQKLKSVRLWNMNILLMHIKENNRVSLINILIYTINLIIEVNKFSDRVTSSELTTYWRDGWTLGEYVLIRLQWWYMFSDCLVVA